MKKFFSLLLIVLMAAFLTAGIVGCNNEPVPDTDAQGADEVELIEEEAALGEEGTE